MSCKPLASQLDVLIRVVQDAADVHAKKVELAYRCAGATYTFGASWINASGMEFALNQIWVHYMDSPSLELIDAIRALSGVRDIWVEEIGGTRKALGIRIVGPLEESLAAVAETLAAG